MGRKVLQRSPKPSNSNPGTPTPSENGTIQPESLQSDDSSRNNPQTPLSPDSRGLDRVLLERNLERLLNEKTCQAHSPDLEKLLHARDRSREPLHLADLSLDDWSPTAMNDNESSDNNKPDNSSCETDNNNKASEEPPHASSMPELGVPSSESPPDSTTPSSPSKKNKALLSVRFLADNEAFEGDEGDAVSVEASRKFPRSRSYSGRSKHVDTLERRSRPRKTTSESQMASTSRQQTDDDAESYCSTCSSSSSSDDLDYQLPPRRAYGGVRISYVPNDALACARRRQATTQKSPNKKGALDDKDKNCIIS